MSEPVLSRKRQGAQDAVDTLETFEAFEAFDKHGLPAFVRGVDAEALYFFWRFFRTGTLPRAAEQLGISLSSANRMLAKLRTYWDDPLFVRSGFLMQPTTAAKRRYDKVLSLMHVLEDLRRDDELDPRTLSRTVRTACYDNAFALCIASIFADFTARMPHVRLRPRRPMNISLIICVRICSIWCSLPGRDSTQIFILRRSSPRRTSVWCGADTLSLNVLQLWGPLNAKILKPSRRCSSMPSPTATVLPNSPGNGWFNPKNPDRIALVTPFFLAASLCLEETDCYAIVPKATAELALDPRRTAMLALSDAAPKLTVRLGWHERTHADPGSQLIRAQLLALIQKRFGLPAGE